MRDNVVEIRNSFGMPMHVRKAVPMDHKEVQNLMVWTLILGAIAGSLLTLAAVFVWESCR